MKQKNKKILKRIFLALCILIIGFITFILYETKDEINANLTNVEEKLNQFYNQKRLGGFAVSVFNSDSIIYSKGFGYSNIEKKIPYTKKTQQYIASISKTAIGVALMKAEELNLLSTKDPINNYLPFKVFNPKFPNIEITIEHLATHTSSLDYNESVVESLYIDETDKEESLGTFMKDYFQDGKYGEIKFTDYAPGSNWNYSNIGAGIVAYIIERKSGMSFSEFTSTYIFEPLALNNTFWFESESDSILHTKYYEPTKKNTIIEVNTSGVKLYPCRDMITNIEDLTKYFQTIVTRSPQLLKVESFEKLLSPKIDNSVSNRTVDNSALFFMIDRNNYGITYQLTGMNGGDNCINTMMWFDPKTKLGYIFIGNTGQSEKNRVNHIWIYRTLVSLGDNILMENSSFSKKIEYKWHNLFNRVRALF